MDISSPRTGTLETRTTKGDRSATWFALTDAVGEVKKCFCLDKWMRFWACWLRSQFCCLRRSKGISQSGAIDGSPYSQTVGYDLSRTWNVGMTPDQYLKLGDIKHYRQRSFLCRRSRRSLWARSFFQLQG
ncbi:MAG: hypothetical protein V7L01_06505 [Nostoc sp.]|uniref:hypothetical protein n=1 Tax=Nostoc sp. TaxID=1180 RepID=UPI002FF461C5